MKATISMHGTTSGKRQSLNTRLDFLDIVESDTQRLRALGDRIDQQSAGFVDGFYDHLLQFHESGALIKDEAQLVRLKNSQRQYVRELLKGQHDDAYLEQRSRIGQVHHKVGVQPYLFVQSSAWLLDSLVKTARDHCSGDWNSFVDQVCSLVKVVMLDVGLVMDAYADADRSAIFETLEKLKESEARLSEAQSLAQLGRWEITLSTDRLRACDRARHLLGLPPDGAGPDALQTLRARVLVGSGQELDAARARAISRGETYEIRYAVAHEDGGSKFIRERAAGITDEHGKVTRLVGTVQDITAQASQVAKIKQLALYDHLTGLPNRAHFYQELQEEMSQRSVCNLPFSLLFIDLDRFKEINDTEGHGIGDKILVEVGSRFRAAMRRDEMVARLGGDEFVVIAKAADGQAAKGIADRLLESLRGPFVIQDSSFIVSASIGISTFPADGATAEMLVRNADTAMYEAKRRHVGLHAYTPDMSAKISRRVSMLKRLREAIENGVIDVHFQPQVMLSTGRLIGAEALARWNDPAFGPVPPSEFILIAEESGLIVPLGEQVIQKSLRHLKAWTASGACKEFRMALNLSATQLASQGFNQYVVDEARAAGVDAGQIDLELTESAIMLDADFSKEILTSLRRHGFGVSVDDFGTGYSSLSHLRGLPITQMKLDRSFVSGMLQSSADLAIVSAARTIATDLGISLIAEGVESVAHVRKLLHIGYEFAQGYYFDQPLSAEDFAAKWLSAR